jgi:hypothetical protein
VATRVDGGVELGGGLGGHDCWVANRGMHTRILTRIIFLVGNSPYSRLNLLAFRRRTLTLSELLHVDLILHLL